MIQYFAVRNAPKEFDGEVIALWEKTRPELHLQLVCADAGVETAMNKGLIEEVDEADFGVMDAIAEIPHILSDGVYHYLGELSHKWKSWTPDDDGVWKQKQPNSTETKVYAVIVNLDEPEDAADFIAQAGAYDVSENKTHDDIIMAEALPENDPLLDIYK